MGNKRRRTCLIEVRGQNENGVLVGACTGGTVVKAKLFEILRVVLKLQLFTVAIHLSQSNKQPSNFVQR